MASRTTNTLRPDNSVVANIRAWAQFIEDTLVTSGGWVVTGDTGQTLPSALTVPGGTNTKVGYRIYRMADSLQATFPVFVRVDYGSGAAAAFPGVWFTIGKGSDGAGTITNQLYTPAASPSVGSNGSSTSQTNNSYASADTARFAVCLFVQAVSNTYFVAFSLERTKNSSGADTGDGLLFVRGGGLVDGGSSASLSRNRYIIYAGGTQPTEETCVSFVLTVQNPSQTFTPGDVGVGILIPFKGVAQQPGTNWMFTNTSDVSVEGFINLTLYGQTRTYQQLSLLVPTKRLTGSQQQDSNARCLMRYD